MKVVIGVCGGKKILECLHYQIFLNSYFPFFWSTVVGRNTNSGFRPGPNSLNGYSKTKML